MKYQWSHITRFTMASTVQMFLFLKLHISLWKYNNFYQLVSLTVNNELNVLPFQVTYVNASPKDLLVSILMTNEILHPVDVVQTQGNGRNKPFHGDVNRKTKILFQEGTRQSSHRLRVLEIQAER